MRRLGRTLTWCGHAGRFYVGLAIFCGGSLAWSLIAGALCRILPRHGGRRLGQFAIMAGFRGGLLALQWLGLARLDLRALDALQASGPLVIACNHRSLLDAVLVISRLPRATCIAKASLWDNPALGGSVRLAGYIRNDAPLPLVRAAAAALRQGSQLVIFPEGTRGTGGALGAFHGGFALIARAADVPIQTVFLEYETPYLGRGWKVHRMPSLPLTYRARCGRRFFPSGRAGDFAAALERYFAEELAGT